MEACGSAAKPWSQQHFQHHRWREQKSVLGQIKANGRDKGIIGDNLAVFPYACCACPAKILFCAPISAKCPRTARTCVRCALIRALHEAGKSVREIAQQRGFNWRSVAKWVRFPAPLERNAMAPRPTSPSYFQDYLWRRWEAGCTRGRHLFEEIKRRGYTGSFSNLERLLAKWRSARHATLVSAPAIPAARAVDPTTGWLISPIVAAALCIKPRASLTLSQTAKIEALKSASADFAVMLRFRGIFRSGDAKKFDAWLDDAQQSGLYAMQRFVRTLRQDIDAVRNALTERWSNG
jgi:hypothetical protein